jgi:hypothetical protein
VVSLVVLLVAPVLALQLEVALAVVQAVLEALVVQVLLVEALVVPFVPRVEETIVPITFHLRTGIVVDKHTPHMGNTHKINVHNLDTYNALLFLGLHHPMHCIWVIHLVLKKRAFDYEIQKKGQKETIIVFSFQYYSTRPLSVI